MRMRYTLLNFSRHFWSKECGLSQKYRTKDLRWILRWQLDNLTCFPHCPDLGKSATFSSGYSVPHLLLHGRRHTLTFSLGPMFQTGLNILWEAFGLLKSDQQEQTLWAFHLPTVTDSVPGCILYSWLCESVAVVKYPSISTIIFFNTCKYYRMGLKSCKGRDWVFLPNSLSFPLHVKLQLRQPEHSTGNKTLHILSVPKIYFIFKDLGNPRCNPLCSKYSQFYPQALPLTSMLIHHYRKKTKCFHYVSQITIPHNKIKEKNSFILYESYSYFLGDWFWADNC